MYKFFKEERGQFPPQIILIGIAIIITIIFLWYIDQKATDFLIGFIFERVVTIPFAATVFPIILIILGIIGIKIPQKKLVLVYELIDAYILYKFIQFIRL